MRTKYLGKGWDKAKVRGTKHNTGDGLNMAFEHGAASYGEWSGCHAVFHDMNGPKFSDLKIAAKYRKISYPWGIVINANGERFVDEGEDLRNYTYAKFGREVIKQPKQFAWQIFDQKVRPMLYSEYDVKTATKVKANTIEELVKETGKYFGYSGSYVYAPTYPGSVSRRCPDLSKARKMFNFNPTITWKEALHNSLDWYEKFYRENSVRFFTGPNKHYNK